MYDIVNVDDVSFVEVFKLPNFVNKREYVNSQSTPNGLSVDEIRPEPIRRLT